MTIQSSVSYSFEIEKSRFLCLLHRIHSVDEAKSFLEKARRDYPDADHAAHAYRLGDSVSHSSDDKEPAGTAGIPIREVLEKNSVTDVIAIVVRWFGGVKLGAGGLARAYGRAAAGALARSTLVEQRTVHEYSLETDYSSVGRLESLIRASCTLVRVDYGITPVITFRSAADPSSLVSEWTNGKGKAQYIGDYTAEIIIRRPEAADRG